MQGQILQKKRGKGNLNWVDLRNELDNLLEKLSRLLKSGPF